MGLFCGVLWVCFVVAVGLLVVLCWWWLCRIFFYILFVISDFFWSGLRKNIGDLVFFYLFLLWTSGRWWWWWWWWLWLWLMVEVVMVGAVDVFLGSEIYYFIVVVILFYCDVYIILLY